MNNFRECFKSCNDVTIFTAWQERKNKSKRDRKRKKEEDRRRTKSKKEI
jgi:hypothetical protein